MVTMKLLPMFDFQIEQMSVHVENNQKYIFLSIKMYLPINNNGEKLSNKCPINFKICQKQKIKHLYYLHIN